MQRYVWLASLHVQVPESREQGDIAPPEPQEQGVVVGVGQGEMG